VASIKRRPNGAWRARYRDASGKEHARHFPRRVDAQKWLDGEVAGLVTGQWVDPKDGRVSFTSYAERWLSSRPLRPNSVKVYRNAIEHASARFGSRPMSSIRPSDLQGLLASLAVDHAPRSVARVAWIVGSLFKSAVSDRMIPVSPMVGVKLPRVDSTEVTIPSRETVAALVDAVPSTYRPLLLLLAAGGLRISEALALRTSDLDWLRRTVRIERQVDKKGNDAPTKTGKSRTVPLAQTVIDELAAHLATRDHASEYLFTDPAGRPLRYDTWLPVWKAATEAVGQPGLNTHSLRHFAASVLLSGGLSVKAVSAMLGHSNASVTLRVYSHLIGDEDDRTRAILDAALDGLRTSRGPNDHPGEETAGQSAVAIVKR
jgi:integrase